MFYLSWCSMFLSNISKNFVCCPKASVIVVERAFKPLTSFWLSSSYEAINVLFRRTFFKTGRKYMLFVFRLPNFRQTFFIFFCSVQIRGDNVLCPVYWRTSDWWRNLNFTARFRAYCIRWLSLFKPVPCLPYGGPRLNQDALFMVGSVITTLFWLVFSFRLRCKERPVSQRECKYTHHFQFCNTLPKKSFRNTEKGAAR